MPREWSARLGRWETVTVVLLVLAIVYGAALGALLLACIGSALVVLKVDQFWEQAIDGFLLLVAIGLDRLLALRVAALLTKRSGPRHAA